jgi:hypothetical protein
MYAGDYRGFESTAQRKRLQIRLVSLILPRIREIDRTVSHSASLISGNGQSQLTSETAS